MLTIRHITPIGNETILEAREIHYSPHPTPPEPAPGFGHLVGSVWYDNIHCDGLLELRNGIVYVMNDAGSTTAKFDLGGWSEPK